MPFTDNINPPPESSASAAPKQPLSTDPATAGHAVSSNAPRGYSKDTKISSVADLKEKAPEVHEKMMEGIAENIISDMKEHQERLEKMWDESRRR